MVGKMSKIAQGHMMTHVAGNQVDLDFLATVVARCGAPPGLQDQIRAANTARHFQELALAAGLRQVFERLAELVCEQCAAVVQGTLSIECLIFDFDGTLLGRAQGPCHA
jgi:cobalt-precorrin-5B (C1)-methyltransferase